MKIISSVIQLGIRKFEYFLYSASEQPIILHLNVAHDNFNCCADLSNVGRSTDVGCESYLRKGSVPFPKQTKDILEMFTRL